MPAAQPESGAAQVDDMENDSDSNSISVADSQGCNKDF